MLYEAFDNFLNLDTWHTNHANDDERFFLALGEVIDNPKFNPDELGEYMRQKKRVYRDDEQIHFNSAIDRRVAAAWAVKEYLKANKL